MMMIILFQKIKIKHHVRAEDQATILVSKLMNLAQKEDAKWYCYKEGERGEAEQREWLKQENIYFQTLPTTLQEVIGKKVCDWVQSEEEPTTHNKQENKYV